MASQYVDLPKPAGGGGGGTPGGSNGQLQYNNAGSFGGTFYTYSSGDHSISAPDGVASDGGSFIFNAGNAPAGGYNTGTFIFNLGSQVDGVDEPFQINGAGGLQVSGGSISTSIGSIDAGGDVTASSGHFGDTVDTQIGIFKDHIQGNTNSPFNDPLRVFSLFAMKSSGDGAGYAFDDDNGTGLFFNGTDLTLTCNGNTSFSFGGDCLFDVGGSTNFSSTDYHFTATENDIGFTTSNVGDESDSGRISFTTGPGGNSNDDAPGGNGGNLSFTAGHGGSGAADEPGGNGGSLRLAAGDGGLDGGAGAGAAGTITLQGNTVVVGTLSATGTFGNIFTGNLNINATQTMKKVYSVQSSLDFSSISAGASSDLTITVTGAAVGDSVYLGLPSAPAAGIIFQAFVSATDTVTVRATNITALSVDPASATYRVTDIQF